MIWSRLAVSALALLPLSAGPALAGNPLPFEVGGAFELVDQSGDVRTHKHPDGHYQLLFFGYATCQQICSAAFPLMAEVVDMLEEEDIALTPVMVTIDPERDTADAMGPALEFFHESFIGLTGSQDALDVAYDAFSVEREYLFDDPEYGPVYAHGSFIYLLDGEGEVKSLLPPILAPEQMADIVRTYAVSGES